MRKNICLFLAVVAIMTLLLPATASAANLNFTPNPQTTYARDFIAKCDGQQWFINEVEQQLNSRQKTLNTVASSADFSYITTLGFADEGITGNIPRAVGELTNLQYLFLGGNKLSGAIPAELFSLDKLQNVDLSRNSYTGAIPSGFGDMASLSVLNLMSVSMIKCTKVAVKKCTEVASRMDNYATLFLGENRWGGWKNERSNLDGNTIRPSKRTKLQ